MRRLRSIGFFGQFIIIFFLSSCYYHANESNSDNLTEHIQTQTYNTEVTEIVEDNGEEKDDVLIDMGPSMSEEQNTVNDFNINYYCPTIEFSDNTSIFPGTMIFASNFKMEAQNIIYSGETSNSNLFFWKSDTENRLSYNLEEYSEYYYFLESPDKTKIAFTAGKSIPIEKSLYILNNNAMQLDTVILLDEWSLFDWLNNEQLLLRQHRMMKDATIDMFDLISYSIIDSKRDTLTANYPNIYTKELFWDWGTLTLYNPDQSYVLYPQREEYILANLWDVNKGELIGRFCGGDWARWSNDGEKFFYVENHKGDFSNSVDEINIIDTSGEGGQITSFANDYEKLFIELPVWSPDGDYIAFLLSKKAPIHSGNLAIMDVENGTVDIYCQSLVPYPFRFGGYTLEYAEIAVNSASPIWSPDGKYILVEDVEYEGHMAYIYDLEEHRVIKIGEGVRPVAWLK